MSGQKPSPIAAGLGCRCPNCGKGKLFQGYLTVRQRCEVCGFDLRAADSGDGPVFFITLIGGFICAFGAFYTDVKFEPPLWVQFVLWIPLTIAICGLMLRPFKSLLIALQFHHKAAPLKIRAGKDDKG
jgi:uncharacterized protein (DUF983 family)